ncbi:MAG: DNA sulfur modification protein DndD [Planctomycetes bacterium]|nr:DNA sulfur modification protein DndD [Planctomycetota bacterium]
MNINKLTLFNYGPFYEKNLISFNNEHKNNISLSNNIILIGGKNGSGKTSLFTALQICLYGQSALGPKTSRRAYEDFLRDQIHRKKNSLFETDTASIEIDFDFSVCGNNDNYLLKRTWQAKSNRELVETLIVNKNGKPLDSYEEYYWQDFVKYLIPQGLLKLFFFDGERINALTKENDNAEFGSSVQSLFGLDLLKQLKADLRYFQRKNVAGSNSNDILSKISAIDNDVFEININIEGFDKEIASLMQKVDSLNTSLIVSEDKLRSVGGHFVDSRDRIRVDILAHERIIEDKNKELKALFQRELPFVYSTCFLKQTTIKIEEELDERRRIKYKEEFEASWRATKNKIIGFLTSSDDLAKIYQLLSRVNDKKKKNLIFNDLSDNNLNDISDWFKISALDQKSQALIIAADIEKLQKEKDELSKKLEYIPSGEDFSTLIGHINELSKEKGEAEGQINTFEIKKKELIKRLDILLRNKSKLETEISNIAKGDRKLILVDKSIQVLDNFEAALISSKIKALEDNILTSLNKLLRKNDIINNISISEDDFRVNLEDYDHRRIDKGQLSEGEKQIYAVSLLAGITRTTKRAFPVFFDTPLGRLDSDHRMNIIHNYFPTASHQLIILSTDTEIDRKYFEEIRPYVSFSYLLDFDLENNCSVIKEGYFWK